MREEREQLLVDLRKFKEDQFQLTDGAKAGDYLPLMVKYIGDPDPELRDHLIYQTFYYWILETDYLNEQELRQLLTVVLDEEHLFYQIGCEGDQSIFTRAFSVLVVALILAAHQKRPILDQTLFNQVKEQLLRYYLTEQDLRADTEANGWADGVAHGADALGELVACPESDAELCREVLAAIEHMLYNGRHSFAEEEDERIISVVERIIVDQLLPETELIDWLEGLTRCGEWEYSRSQRTTRMNVKKLIRSIYFRIIHTEKGQRLVDPLLHMETRLNSFV